MTKRKIPLYYALTVGYSDDVIPGIMMRVTSERQAYQGRKARVNGQIMRLRDGAYKLDGPYNRLMSCIILKLEDVEALTKFTEAMIAIDQETRKKRDQLAKLHNTLSEAMSTAAKLSHEQWVITSDKKSAWMKEHFNEEIPSHWRG